MEIRCKIVWWRLGRRVEVGEEGGGWGGGWRLGRRVEKVDSM